MRTALARRPSPALIVAFVALVAALAGTAVAGPVAGLSVLNKKEKKQTRNIAKKVAGAQIKKRAKNLTVANAENAVTAQTAVSAQSAGAVNGLFNSGLVKMSIGDPPRTLLQRGPFEIITTCTDAGGGIGLAKLDVKNTGTEVATLYSSYNDEYATPELAPGATREGFYPADNGASEYWGQEYNQFVASAPNGPSISGEGAIGSSVLGADCVFNLVLTG